MSYTDNRTILQKADLALADLTVGGGLLKPAQAQKLRPRLFQRPRLAQNLPPEGQHLIAAQDEGTWMAIAGAQRLYLGQMVSHVAGRRGLGQQRVADRRLIDTDRKDVEGQPGVTQQSRADGRAGGEDEGFGHRRAGNHVDKSGDRRL